MLHFRVTTLIAAAGAALLLAGCATSTQPKPAFGYAPVDPVLPETVTALPSGVAGDENDGAHSLAREMEKSGGAQAALPAPKAEAATAVAALAPVAEPTPTVADAAPVPVAPTPATQPETKIAAVEEPGVAVASLAPVSEAETPAAASIRGVAPTKPAPDVRVSEAGSVAARSEELDGLMAHYANYYGVPEELVRRVAKRESTFNPRAKNGPYLGLMQISLPTARGMGYRGGANGLLDAETNLKYAVRYLRGAFVVAQGNHSRADRLYQTGYYYHAKRAGLLDETGVGTDRKRRRSRS